jgi:hypothetical protein
LLQEASLRRLPNFAVSKADAALITRIAERAVSMAERYGRRAELLGVCANLMACHANGCRLRLDALLAADDLSFMCDVWGIGRHLDRATGTLAGRFAPRFAAPPPHEHAREGASIGTSTGATARERRDGGGERASAGQPPTADAGSADDGIGESEAA